MCTVLFRGLRQAGERTVLELQTDQIETLGLHNFCVQGLRAEDVLCTVSSKYMLT